MDHLSISYHHNNETGRLDMCGCAHWSDVGLGGSDTSLLVTKCDLRMSLGLQSVIEWSRNKPVQKEKITATFFCKRPILNWLYVSFCTDQCRYWWWPKTVIIISSVRQLCNRHDSSWLGKRGKNMKVTINTITMAAFYHDTLHFSFPYNELYVYTLPISMMRQRKVESIALLLRTKSNTCSKTPPFQHTLPIINTCLSSHLANDQHHLGFATLSAGLTAP